MNNCTEEATQNVGYVKVFLRKATDLILTGLLVEYQQSISRNVCYIVVYHHPNKQRDYFLANRFFKIFFLLLLLFPYVALVTSSFLVTRRDCYVMMTVM